MTGATGVIGRRALPLLRERHTVTAAVRDAAARDRLTATGVQSAIVDLFDPGSLRVAMTGHDCVINLATHIPASAWKMLFRKSWAENEHIRSTGVRNLVNAARACNVTRFIQESYAPAYPDRGDAWIDETTPLDPPAYTHALVDAEAAVGEFAEIPPRVGVILRFGSFYGPDAFQSLAMVNGVRHGWAMIPGGPEPYLSSVSHDDAALAVVAAVSAQGGTYNVSDDEPLRRGDYFGSLAEALGAKPPHFPPTWLRPLFGAPGEVMSRSVRASNRKFRDETGWRPLYPSVREGWRAMIAALPGGTAHATA